MTNDSAGNDYRPYALVVDDEVIIRMDAAMLLEDHGFGVFEAANAGQALVILREHYRIVTLLFTDVDMPGSVMDGFALARHTAEHWPDIGILVASGRRAPEPGDMPDGAMFVPKPFSAEIVRDRLKELLPDDRRPDPLKE